MKLLVTCKFHMYLLKVKFVFIYTRVNKEVFFKNWTYAYVKQLIAYISLDEYLYVTTAFLNDK